MLTLKPTQMYNKISVLFSALVWILLPKCSACLAAYLGLFSALGMGKLVSHPLMLPAIKILLAVNIISSLYLAIKEKKYVYAVISFVCAVVFIANKLYFNSGLVNIAAGAVLITAAFSIRLMHVKKRACIFKEEGKVVC